jgi:predicted nucleic acid-binding protein
VSPGICCVTDTNIWIDLRVGGLLDSVFELDARWLIPDLIRRELGEDLADLLMEWGLEERVLSGDEVEAVIELNAKYAGPSRTDMATLVVARTEGGVLVTGDSALRDAASAEGIEVHSTLWIVDHLVNTGTVRPNEAARALQLIMEGKRRLPHTEVRRRIKKWQG